MARRNLLILLLALGLPALLMLPVWWSSGLGAGEDDVLYYYPSRVLFGEMIRAGQWPWLNALSGMTRPFLADPQSAVFYPSTWLFTILPPKPAYAASLWLHCTLAFWGMYRLLRAQRMDPRAALFGAIAFAFCGFMLAHRAHFTMQHAAAWLPIVLWRLERYAARGGVSRLAILAAVQAGMCYAGHQQIAALTALGTLIYLVASARERRRTLLRWALGWGCTAGLFALQALPTFAYLLVCTRGERGYLDFTENSWNPLSIVGWIFPMFFGQRTPNFFSDAYWGPSHQVEQFAYAGILPLLLALLTLMPGWRGDPHRRSWWALLLFSLLVALGIFGPICPILYWLPGASLFRVPARALLLVDFALVALAARAIHDLVARPTPDRAVLRARIASVAKHPILRAALCAAVLLVPAWLTWIWLPDPIRGRLATAALPWRPAIWIPFVLLTASIAALGFVARQWRRPQLVTLLTLVTVIDLGIIGGTIDVPTTPLPDSTNLRTTERDAWVQHVDPRVGRLWVVTGRHGGVPGQYIDPLDRGIANINVLDALPALTDYGPLQPRRYSHFVPAKPWGELPQAQAFLDQPAWMSRWNVAWVLLCEEHWRPPPNAEHVTTTPGGKRLYRVDGGRGWAYLDDATLPAALRVDFEAPYRIRVTADQYPARLPAPDGAKEAASLVLAILALPGWQARCDGEAMPVSPTGDGLLRAVLPTPPAPRNDRPTMVEWTYLPPGLREGCAITAISALLLTSGVVLEISRRRRG